MKVRFNPYDDKIIYLKGENERERKLLEEWFEFGVSVPLGGKDVGLICNKYVAKRTPKPEEAGTGLDPDVCPNSRGKKCEYYNWHNRASWECMNGYMESRPSRNVPCKREARQE